MWSLVFSGCFGDQLARLNKSRIALFHALKGGAFAAQFEDTVAG
jgi:hypothetical protein